MKISDIVQHTVTHKYLVCRYSRVLYYDGILYLDRLVALNELELGPFSTLIISSLYTTQPSTLNGLFHEAEVDCEGDVYMLVLAIA